MKRTLVTIGLLGLGLTMLAQPGAIATREGNAPSGKILTMEETILSRELAAENLYCSWNSEKEILMRKDGQWIVFNIETRQEKPFKLPKTKEPKVYTKGRSLYYHCG